MFASVVAHGPGSHSICLLVCPVVVVCVITSNLVCVGLVFLETKLSTGVTSLHTCIASAD